MATHWELLAGCRQYAKIFGHDLVNWRANQPLGKAWSVYGSINNLADVRYAESAGLNQTNLTYAPGLPRSYFLGLEYQFGND